MARQRDYQRSKVYAWENAQPWMDKKSDLKEKDINKAMKRLNKIFRKRIRCSIRNGEHYKSYANSWLIVLRREWALNYAVLLHEYAHSLEAWQLETTEDGHGKDFVSIYCCLLHAFHPTQPSFSDLAQSCNEHGVEFREFDYWWEKLGLTKRLKPFKQPHYEVEAPKPKVKRVTPRQRVEALLEKYPTIVVTHDYCEFYLVSLNSDWEFYCTGWLEVEEAVLKIIDHLDSPEEDDANEEVA